MNKPVNDAVFTKGPTMKHVVVMSSTSAVGLMAIFIVDLIDMFFLGLLGEAELAAAIGYAGTILFFTTSINIGAAIATGALTSRAIGQQEKETARTVASNSILFAAVFALIFSCIIWFNIPNLLTLLGASGKTLELAITYLTILVPSMAILAVGMCASSVLRATGDAKGAMYATLVGGGVNLVLDPILIFALDMGISGAAWASVAARVAVFAVAVWGAAIKHALIGRFSLSSFRTHLSEVLKIALPAMLTNAATPLGNAYVIKTVASFGDSAVAGMSIVGRLTPVAFGIIFALSGAIGPIIGQNYGAGNLHRVKQTIIDSLKFSGALVCGISLLLYVLQHLIIQTFGATAESAEMISAFCTWVAGTFFFTGMVFIANASFNNLGFPLYSTANNFCKAIITTIPCVYLGALWAGHTGVLYGQAISSIIVGTLSLWFCFKLINSLDKNETPPPSSKHHGFHLRFPRWSMSNTRG